MIALDKDKRESPIKQTLKHQYNSTHKIFSKNHELWLHNDFKEFKMTNIEILGFTSAFLTTFSFLPQAIQVIKTRDTASLSLAMYSIFTLGVGFWLIYGLIKQDSAMIVANIITFILSSAILSIKVYNDFFKKSNNTQDFSDACTE